MEIDLTPRPASASRVSLSIIIMPGEANPYGTMHGGVMLRLADECGAIAALRHVGHGQITTAAIDSMIFLGPVLDRRARRGNRRGHLRRQVVHRVAHRDLRRAPGTRRPAQGRRRLRLVRRARRPGPAPRASSAAPERDRRRSPSRRSRACPPGHPPGPAGRGPGRAGAGGFVARSDKRGSNHSWGGCCGYSIWGTEDETVPGSSNLGTDASL